MSSYHEKYLKYKSKYTSMKNELKGGSSTTAQQAQTKSICTNPRELQKIYDDFRLTYNYPYNNKIRGVINKIGYAMFSIVCDEFMGIKHKVLYVHYYPPSTNVTNCVIPSNRVNSKDEIKTDQILMTDFIDFWIDDSHSIDGCWKGGQWGIDNLITTSPNWFSGAYIGDTIELTFDSFGYTDRAGKKFIDSDRKAIKFEGKIVEQSVTINKLHDKQKIVNKDNVYTCYVSDYPMDQAANDTLLIYRKKKLLIDINKIISLYSNINLTNKDAHENILELIIEINTCIDLLMNEISETTIQLPNYMNKIHEIPQNTSDLSNFMNDIREKIQYLKDNTTHLIDDNDHTYVIREIVRKNSIVAINAGKTDCPGKIMPGAGEHLEPHHTGLKIQLLDAFEQEIGSRRDFFKIKDSFNSYLIKVKDYNTLGRDARYSIYNYKGYKFGIPRLSNSECYIIYIDDKKYNSKKDLTLLSSDTMEIDNDKSKFVFLDDLLEVPDEKWFVSDHKQIVRDAKETLILFDNKSNEDKKKYLIREKFKN